MYSSNKSAPMSWMDGADGISRPLPVPEDLRPESVPRIIDAMVTEALQSMCRTAVLGEGTSEQRALWKTLIDKLACIAAKDATVTDAESEARSTLVRALRATIPRSKRLENPEKLAAELLLAQGQFFADQGVVPCEDPAPDEPVDNEARRKDFDYIVTLTKVECKQETDIAMLGADDFLVLGNGKVERGGVVPLKGKVKPYRGQYNTGDTKSPTHELIRERLGGAYYVDLYLDPIEPDGLSPQDVDVLLQIGLAIATLYGFDAVTLAIALASKLVADSAGKKASKENVEELLKKPEVIAQVRRAVAEALSKVINLILETDRFTRLLFTTYFSYDKAGCVTWNTIVGLSPFVDGKRVYTQKVGKRIRGPGTATFNFDVEAGPNNGLYGLTFDVSVAAAG